MRPFIKLLTTTMFLLPLAAQDYRDLHSSVDEFKGLSAEVVKKNPLLATGANAMTATKGGVDSIMNGLGLKKPAPVMETPTIRLSKEQQAIVDREAARKAKAEAAAAGKTGTAKPRSAKPAATRAAISPAAAKKPTAPAMAIAPMPAAPAKPETKKVAEESVKAISTGMDREQLVASLGPPKSVSAITGIEGGPRETLAYELESGQFLFVKVLGGKVQSISR